MIITLLTTETNFWENFSANLLSAPGNVIQAIVGIIVAIPLAKLVEKSVRFKSIGN